MKQRNVRQGLRKIPTRRFPTGSYSSDSRPTSFRRASSRSNIALASASRPINQRLVTIQKLHARNAPSPPLNPSFVFFVSYRSTNPFFISRFSIAFTVPITRGSSGGKNPTAGIKRHDASNCFDPYDCTKLFSFLSNPFFKTSRRIISRFYFHRVTSP